MPLLLLPSTNLMEEGIHVLYWFSLHLGILNRRPESRLSQTLGSESVWGHLGFAGLL